MTSTTQATPLTTSTMPRTSAEMSTDIRGCRHCGAPLRHVVVDLGLSPLCENLVPRERLNTGEMFYPLRTFVCEECWLIQVHELVTGEEIYSHYAYFSSNSTSWLEHANRYCEAIVDRLQLSDASQVIEIASNDGYLLQHFKQRGIPAMGIEPAANVAQVAIDKGLDCVVKFFGVQTARELVDQGIRADLLIGNNVIGHVPDLNDFVAGLKLLLAAEGTVSIEIPHALHLIQQNQFDTIYQEHYSYYLLLTMRQLLARHGLTLFDVEEIPTHGGSLRYYAKHDEDDTRTVQPSVEDMEAREIAQGLTKLSAYREFSQRVKETKWNLLEFLIKAQRDGKQVVGYGAPGKAATLLNYCGVREDLLAYTVDRNEMKQDTYMVGTLIPIHAPAMIAETKPDYIVILPWNLKEEIMAQLDYVRAWGAKFVIPIPELTICE